MLQVAWSAGGSATAQPASPPALPCRCPPTYPTIVRLQLGAPTAQSHASQPTHAWCLTRVQLLADRPLLLAQITPQKTHRHTLHPPMFVFSRESSSAADRPLARGSCAPSSAAAAGSHTAARPAYFDSTSGSVEGEWETANGIQLKIQRSHAKSETREANFESTSGSAGSA